MSFNHFKGLAGLSAVAALAVGSVAVSPVGAHERSTASIVGDTLTVTGTNGGDDVALRLAPAAPGTLHIDIDGDGAPEFALDRSTFRRVVVLAGNGDDVVLVDQTNGSFVDELITVDGGNGDDTFAGGDGNDVFLGGRGNDNADGNRGADVASLGAGDDSFRWDPGDASDVVDGDAGFDTLDFRGAAASENMRLVPGDGGARALFLRDPGSIRMDLDDVERVVSTTLGGADTFITDDLSSTDVRVVGIDLSAPVGSIDGSDVVIVNGTDAGDAIAVRTTDGETSVEGLAAAVRITESEVVDRLAINGLDGDDRIDVAGGVADVISVTVDLGPGQS